MRSIRNLLGLSAVVVLTGIVVLVAPTTFAAQTSSTPTTETKKTTKLADRIIEYKAKQAVKLAAAEETKLKGVCKAAQVKVKAVDTRTTAANTARTKIYNGIVKQLETIIPKLKDASVDTTELTAAQTQLKSLLQKYNDDYVTFQTSLADTSEIDCITDPSAFKSALLNARSNRVVLIADAKAIKEYIPTVKTGLQNAKKALTTDTTTSTGDEQ